ncbi:MAG: hypothetical protein IPP15_21890 [Saprospiraceae bacterium]|uniref:Peptidase A2 domain-containing protein n=1 Tax=Candidatus Opimibacter skivensis TaxID=2982028 RepID=A0A9D7T0G8_9BACT|nr:hypothetical protein [Candidatus Opimibacter skivensis]
MNRYLFIFIFLIPMRILANPYPISIVNGLLVSKATIEGKEVLIIFDTGAPGLVLNSRFYKPDNKTKIECEGINGSFQCSMHEVRNWNWMGIAHKKTNALLSDLTFLENELNSDVYALIGLSAVDNYYVSIDFDQRSISLTDKMKVDKQSMIRFQYADHLPVISCKVNGKKKYLGIDTGSEINYLFTPHKVDADHVSTNGSFVSVVGTENRTDMKFRLTMELALNNSDVYSSPFIIDLQDKGSNLNDSLDGLLGQPFLSHFNITIHPSKQIIILTPRNQTENFSAILTAQL